MSMLEENKPKLEEASQIEENQSVLSRGLKTKLLMMTQSDRYPPVSYCSFI